MTELPPLPEPIPPAPGLPPPAAQPVGRDGLPDRPDLERPLATWRWWEVVIAYLLGTFVLGALVSLPILLITGTDGLGLIAASAAIDIVLLGALVVWLNRAHPTWRRIMGFPARDQLPREIAAGMVGAVLILLVSGIVGAAIQSIVDAISDERIVAPDQIPDDLGVSGTILTVVFVVAIAPVVEEFVFRGLLFRSIRDRYGLWPGLLLSSLAFGLVHGGIGNEGALADLLLQVPLTFVGIGFAYVYERRGNLIAPIAAHVTFNVIGLIVIFVGI